MSTHPEIRTPKISPQPRINGAKIVGARPGHPFLFKVAASGQKPLDYEARDLPGGLAIDRQTGIISGSVHEPGLFTVKLTVKNQLGVANRELRIKIGDSICLTPPMGWNSWYCHSELISEEAIRETAQAIIAKGLAEHGWTYVNIDDCWQGLRGGPHHAIQPNNRFTDMKGMCDFLHSLGLKAGIYSTPWQGTYAGFIGGSAPNERGDYSGYFLPAAERLQEYQVFGRYPGSLDRKLNHVGHWFFEQDAIQWAEWGFDYVKVDWMPNDIPTTQRIHTALQKCGRDIILSLSNTAPFENVSGLSQYAHCWRTTGDIRDTWDSISGIGFSQEPWQTFTSPGHWNDPDMLQVGKIGIPNQKNTTFNPTHLTAQEQYSQISLWCLLSAPLLISCDIASLDDFTLALLTNDEVIEVNQDPAGHRARRVAHDGEREIWTKPLEDGSQVIGLFNTCEHAHETKVTWAELGLSGAQRVRDLWRQKDMGTENQALSTYLAPHDVMLIKITPV